MQKTITPTVRFINFMFLFFIFGLKLQAQTITNIEFQQVKCKVKEKYGSYTVHEKLIKSKNVVLSKFLKKSTHSEGNLHITQFDISTKDSILNKIVVHFSKDSTERFYGGGEQFSNFLLNGSRYFLIPEEQGSGRGDKPVTNITKLFGVAGSATTTYFPIPFFVSSKNYSFTISKDNWHTPIAFDFKSKTEVRIEFYANNVSFEIFAPNSTNKIISDSFFLKAVEKQMQKNAPAILPNWAYGTILGLQGGQKKVDSILDTCLELGNPVTAIWIQDWCGRRKTRLGSQLRWAWEVDTTLYPNFKSWTEKLQQKGVVVLGYINPFLSVGTSMFDSAKANHLLLEDDKGKAIIQKTGGFDAGLINLFETNSQQWIQGRMRAMIDSGMHGWMGDFGEWAPLNFSNKSKLHNWYVAQWTELNSEMKNYDTSFACFMRAGTNASPSFQNLYWMGDQLVNWGENDGIQSTVTAINSAGISGIPNLHSDIGGYTTLDNIFIKVKRDKELFMRWAELNVFQAFYRTHEGLKPASNHQFYTDTATLNFFAKMGKLHFYFKPYIQAHQQKNSSPLLHPMLLHFPNDSNCFNLKTQFMFGEDVFVAPVLDKNSTTQKVYLPQGNWIHIPTQKVYGGAQWITVSAPLDTIPYFVNASSDWKEFFINVPKE